MPLGEVHSLSDDEGPSNTVLDNDAFPKPSGSRPRFSGRSRLRVPCRQAVGRVAEQLHKPFDAKHLSNLIRGRCGCKSECFVPIRSHDAQLKEWMTVRKTMAKLTKLEKDQYVRYLASLCIIIVYQYH